MDKYSNTLLKLKKMPSGCREGEENVKNVQL